MFSGKDGSVGIFVRFRLKQRDTSSVQLHCRRGFIAG
jgi:hypothetical protein